MFGHAGRIFLPGKSALEHYYIMLLHRILHWAMMYKSSLDNEKKCKVGKGKDHLWHMFRSELINDVNCPTTSPHTVHICIPRLLSLSFCIRTQALWAGSLGSCQGLVGVCDHLTPLLHNTHLQLNPRRSVYVPLCAWARGRESVTHSAGERALKCYFGSLNELFVYRLLQVFLMWASLPERSLFKVGNVGRGHALKYLENTGVQCSTAETKSLVLSWLGPKGMQTAIT